MRLRTLIAAPTPWKYPLTNHSAHATVEATRSVGAAARLDSWRARADTDRMRLAKGTWAVTLLLAGLLAMVVSFLVMPPLWGWLVERRATPHLGFAALAGALGALFRASSASPSSSRSPESPLPARSECLSASRWAICRGV